MRITSMYSLIRLKARSPLVEWNDFNQSSPPGPIPKIVRPPDISSTSAAAFAISNGLRENACAIPVASLIRDVVEAVSACTTNGLRYCSIPQTESNRASSASCANWLKFSILVVKIGTVTPNWVMRAPSDLRSGMPSVEHRWPQICIDNHYSFPLRRAARRARRPAEQDLRRSRNQIMEEN